jgi:hypothetical protein
MKKARILDRMRALHGGKLYQSEWGTRGSGTGIFADQMKAMFDVAARRAGLNQEQFELSTAHFRKPGEQLALF